VSSGPGKPPAAERIYHETFGYWYRTVWIGDRYHLHRSGGDGPDVCLGEVDATRTVRDCSDRRIVSGHDGHTDNR
jgi:hypothetical protein